MLPQRECPVEWANAVTPSVHRTAVAMSVVIALAAFPLISPEVWKRVTGTAFEISPCQQGHHTSDYRCRVFQNVQLVLLFWQKSCTCSNRTQKFLKQLVNLQQQSFVCSSPWSLGLCQFPVSPGCGPANSCQVTETLLKDSDKAPMYLVNLHVCW